MVRAFEGEDIYGRLRGETVAATESSVPGSEKPPGTLSFAIDVSGVVLPGIGRYVIDVAIGDQNREVHFEVGASGVYTTYG